MDPSNVVTCTNCGQILPADALICPKCGAFVHKARLEQLSHEALRLEQTYPAQAVYYWQQCLPLLPPNSPQYQQIVQRIQHLSQTAGPAGFTAPEPPGEKRLYPLEPRKESLGFALFKTVGSMIVSAAVYAIFFHGVFFHDAWAPSIYFSIGFVILMLIHEMGHVIALRYYGLRAGSPLFLPFVGAVINLRQSPPNALAEAVVGMGGPFLGTIGAIGCFILAFIFPHFPLLMLIAYFGFLLNLFNLLPVPPLDGGRIAAALSPRLWILGLVMLGLLFVYDWMHGAFDWLLLIVLFIAWPRIRMTLQLRHRDLPYYRVPRSGSYAIGALYIGLAIVLIGLMLFIHSVTHISLI
ncbi:MAG TPA: site-2 protease family protein [Tepidisphaeraceae bacterium]|nr:site-2 protease family protein [Tepidisphaeraceae bacterium]